MQSSEKENREDLKKLIKIDMNFQKSVNLSLDLGDFHRLNSYIPTRSSLLILKRYLEGIQGRPGENATILIGPYGKGKSHLLLVLLAIFQGEIKKLSKVLPKIEKVDRETAELIYQIDRKKQRFLPVLISGTGNDLNDSFLYALKEALEREGMTDLAPKSSYSEAVKVLEQWRLEYPKVYQKWQRYLKEQKETSENLIRRLNKMDREAMKVFLECYPSLTAGSRFLPMAQSEAWRVYQEVNRELREHYGYEGMALVFDEFSKYIEGHEKESFARDMKTLQDMCELAERDSEEKLRLILVAHKSIHEYEKGIDKSVKDAFRGVEGRLKEVRFHVTARNHYELIADTLRKEEPAFSEKYEAYGTQTGIREMLEESFRLPCFSSLFSAQEEYQQVMGRGCFPLTPVCAYILLHISEKAAQNERTLFTFLTSQEQGSLPRILEERTEPWIGAEAVYDYFRHLFRESGDQIKIHNEWLKAEYAWKQTENAAEGKIIKAMALIRMIHREDELPAVDETIRLALGMKRETYQPAIQQLKQKGILIFRSSLGTYAFKNNIGVNLEKEIEAEIARQPEKFPICKYLKQISELDYVLPKQHNQERSMTRYFQYEFFSAEEFLELPGTSYLFEEDFSDGKIAALVSEEEIDLQAAAEKTKELKEDRMVVLVPGQPFQKGQSLRRLAAVRSLKEKAEFAKEQKVLLRELELYEEDLVFEINASLEQDFLPGNKGCLALHRAEKPRCFESDMEFNRFLSEICENYYCFSPRVNHELLNIQQVTGQYLRARNKVVRALLQEQGQEYQTGTAPESMVYRAAFVRTGILDSRYERDLGCSRILEEIDGFLMKCVGSSRPFLELYQRLQGKNYGVRKGIVPLFLAQRLARAEGIPVIYLQKKELEVDENVLNHVNEFPEDYQLYLEPESGKKEQYLRTLEQVWQIENTGLATRQRRLVQITEGMQRWYRSLPQYARVTNGLGEEARAIRVFRNLLKRSEPNPREFLFEAIPKLAESRLEQKEPEQRKSKAAEQRQRDLKQAAETVIYMKKCLEQVFSNLEKDVAKDIRAVCQGKPQESLKGCLRSWYQKQSRSVEEYILSKTASEFLEYLAELKTNDEREIIADLSRIFLDIDVEDWNDETLELFHRELEQCREEIQNIAEKPEGKKQRTIILMDEQGHNIKRSYEADWKDSTSNFLKNMIDEAMEDFENTLETSQKVAVLAEVLQELLQ
ncbi:MAG: hypothetical protein HFH41_08760 [Lachnospiraceae bacterium]|nr:hypothetical protein [Lachnospiraceae bacterium]